MKLILDGDINVYYIQTLCMIFFPGAKFGAAEQDDPNVPELRLKLTKTENGVEAVATITADGKSETAEKFWDIALKMYLGTEDEAVCRSVAEKAMIVGYTRMLRRAIRRPNEADSPAKIALCKERLAELLSRVTTLVF